MTFDEAKQIAVAHLSVLSNKGGPNLAIMEDHTLEREFGWVFFWNSKQYLESGDKMQALGGNAPLVVLKKDGSVIVTGTALPVERYLENIDKYGSPEDPSQEQRWEYETRKLLQEGRRADAIEFQRTNCGLGLQAAIDAVKQLEARMAGK